MKKHFILSIIFMYFIAPCFAGTYYVDFDSGNDTNNGTAYTTPWRSLPGTTGQTDWGAINSGAKIPVPSTIYIKGGTTHSSADPDDDNIYIDGTYYTAPTQESERITIKVATTAEWGAA